MKNKKTLMILALAVTLSGVLSACNFGGDEPAEVVEATPTPEPTEAPDPTPTVAPDAQSTTYTSTDRSISIELPDATWANRSDEGDLVSFESPDQGRILIIHGEGAEDMASAVIPSTEDLAVSLEQASDLVNGTDFEIRRYSATNANGVNVYSYVTRMLNTEKSGGYAFVINKYFANDNEYYSITASSVGGSQKAYNRLQKAVDSFQILGDSTLSAATSTESGDGTAAAGEGQAAAGSNGVTPGRPSDDIISDNTKTRTIYRNSDGQPIVIKIDNNGNWVDDNGNTYRFANEWDVYDQNDVDYYYHGEAADVYYMPLPDSE